MRLETKFTLSFAGVLAVLLALAITLDQPGRQDMILWGGEFLIATLVIGYLCVRRYVCVPAAGMAQKMWQIADNKAYDKKLEEEAKRTDELGLPARAFNRVLGEANEKLQELEREKHAAELRVAPLEAELAAMQRDLKKNIEARVAAERNASEAEERSRTLVRRLTETESSLRLTAQRGDFVASTIDTAVFTMDTTGNVRSWNTAAQREFGWSAGECVGHPPVIVPDAAQSQQADLVERLLKGQSFRNVAAIAEKKDGSVVDVRLDVSPAKDTAGKVSELVVVVTSIGVNADASNEPLCQAVDAAQTETSAQASPTIEQTAAPAADASEMMLGTEDAVAPQSVVPQVIVAQPVEPAVVAASPVSATVADAQPASESVSVEQSETIERLYLGNESIEDADEIAASEERAERAAMQEETARQPRESSSQKHQIRRVKAPQSAKKIRRASKAIAKSARATSHRRNAA